MLDKTLVKVFCNIGVPLLFRCSLLRFNCCDFNILEWSINKKLLSKPIQSNICLPNLLLPWNNYFVLWCLKWSHHAWWFLNWTQHRLLILQSDLVTGQNLGHLYRYKEQNCLGFLLKTVSNNFSCNVPALHPIKWTNHIVGLNYFVAAYTLHSSGCMVQVTSQLGLWKNSVLQQ